MILKDDQINLMLYNPLAMHLLTRLSHYAYLVRLHKPIGILLLLWPTLWALWLAGLRHPDAKIVIIFVLGVVLMRSAGCAMNDFADRAIDTHVKRTRERPIAAGAIKPYEALIVAGVLAFMAFLLVLQCNAFTIFLSLAAVLFAAIYPFLKRVTHLPQLGLGVAFAWGVPMAFAAVQDTIPMVAWVLFLATIVWTVMFDTLYAMVDRDDDVKIGVKSTAILFGACDKKIIAALQATVFVLLSIVGYLARLSIAYYCALIVVALLFLYQQWLIRSRDRDGCFRAFLNNQWVGAVLFLSVFL